MLEDYLELAPDGPRAAEAQELAREIDTEYRALFPGPDEIDQAIADARRELEQQPDSPDRAAALADALWKRGNYDEAGSIYATLASEYPDRAADLGVYNRIEFYRDNTYVVLTPTEVARREKEIRPLEIINLTSFRAVRDSFSAVPRFYVVSGQAVNRSDSMLYDVQVDVTIYGFGNVVYDTNTVFLGRMLPGETRAFSLRFTNFDDINRIDRHEAVGRFQR
jgi:tetratricopeptide (TPR) repeat protein